MINLSRGEQNMGFHNIEKVFDEMIDDVRYAKISLRFYNLSTKKQFTFTNTCFMNKNIDIIVLEVRQVQL